MRDRKMGEKISITTMINNTIKKHDVLNGKMETKK